MSNLRVNSISARAGSGVIAVPSGNTLGQSGLAVQAATKTFNDVTATTTTYTYVPVTNGALSITSKVANSKFLVRFVMSGYFVTSASVNAGISRTVSGVTTRLIGTDGTLGDSWMGAGNGPASGSCNIVREFLDSPGLPVGTVITYNALLGLWSAGTGYCNYSGYTGGSTISIIEVV